MSDDDSARLERLGERVVSLIADFRRESERGERPVIQLDPLAEIKADLDPGRLVEGGLSDDEIVNFLGRYLSRVTRLHHPGYIAHQVAVPGVGSGLADLVNGNTNNGMSIYEMGPPGATLEMAMLEWMLAKVGWSVREGAGGVLTHGGALANLTALAAARAAIAPDAWEEGCPSDLVVLAPGANHYSISRAVALLGIGTKNIVHLPTDAVERYRDGTLPEVHKKVVADGKRVMAVVLNVCTTATGLHDPIESAAVYCREHGVWLHIDAAHGGSALISERERHWLRGIESADSMIWDAHKMLGVSALATAVLVRKKKQLTAAFRQKATYMIRQEGRGPGVNQAKHSFECTKAPLALKFFLNLAVEGEAAVAARLESLYERTRRFHAIISERDGFECPYSPESNILCFRYRPGSNDQDALRDRLIDEGDFYLSAAHIGGARYLRLTVMNERTDEARIESLLDSIERVADAS